MNFPWKRGGGLAFAQGWALYWIYFYGSGNRSLPWFLIWPFDAVQDWMQCHVAWVQYMIYAPQDRTVWPYRQWQRTNLACCLVIWTGVQNNENPPCIPVHEQVVPPQKYSFHLQELQSRFWLCFVLLLCSLSKLNVLYTFHCVLSCRMNTTIYLSIACQVISSRWRQYSICWKASDRSIRLMTFHSARLLLMRCVYLCLCCVFIFVPCPFAEIRFSSSVQTVSSETGSNFLFIAVAVAVECNWCQAEIWKLIYQRTREEKPVILLCSDSEYRLVCIYLCFLQVFISFAKHQVEVDAANHLSEPPTSSSLPPSQFTGCCREEVSEGCAESQSLSLGAASDTTALQSRVVYSSGQQAVSVLLSMYCKVCSFGIAYCRQIQTNGLVCKKAVGNIFICQICKINCVCGGRFGKFWQKVMEGKPKSLQKLSTFQCMDATLVVAELVPWKGLGFFQHAFVFAWLKAQLPIGRQVHHTCTCWP